MRGPPAIPPGKPELLQLRPKDAKDPKDNKDKRRFCQKISPRDAIPLSV